MDLGLKDRVYVVTGATRGLGNAVARELVADGAKVVVTGRDEERAAGAAKALGPDAVGVAVDNADPEAPARLIAAARNAFGRFDGVLVSVGGPPPGFAADITDEQWRTSFESVFLGAVRLARAAAAELEAGGVIGFVLSGSVHEPIPALTVSNGLRPGLAGFAKSLSDELGPRGIRVVGVLLGADRHGPGARAGRTVGRPGGDPRRERVAYPAAPVRGAGGVRAGGRLPAVAAWRPT